MKVLCRYIIIITGIFLLDTSAVFSQDIPQGFRYQTTIRNVSGLAMTGQTINIRFSFFSGSPSGSLVWQEHHLLLTDSYGAVKTIIGNGISTGLGMVASFDQINWAGGVYYLNVSVDLNGGTSFDDYGSTQLFSVPYAFHSQVSGRSDSMSLSKFSDVDTTGLSAGKLLRWNGSYWISSQDNDRDSVTYAFNTGHSANSDSAVYAINYTMPDTVVFSFLTDSVLYSALSQNSISTNTAAHADTALYAFVSAPYAWTLTGNALPGVSKYIGTNDSIPFVFRSNNIERLKISEAGNVLVASPFDIASFSLSGNDGLLAAGVFGGGTFPAAAPGSKMIWYPGKAAFRAGYVNSNQWDSVNVMRNSFAVGYNSNAKEYSIAAGNNCIGGDYTFAIGRKSQATALGAYPNGSGVAMGDSSLAPGQRCVVIGDGNYANTSACVAIGSKNKAGVGVSTALGTNCNANGSYTTAIGYYASANARTGSFVYADASSSTPTNATANYQFKIRADGGIVFYTDSAQTMGVTLFPGSGSWSGVSDENKKTNIQKVDYEEILNKIENLSIRKWNYKSEKRSTKHAGPFAQDFYLSFGLGESDSTITCSDMDGVILAGIKALKMRVDMNSISSSIEQIKLSIDQMNDKDAINKRLDAIEAAINKQD